LQETKGYTKSKPLWEFISFQIDMRHLTLTANKSKNEHTYTDNFDSGLVKTASFTTIHIHSIQSSKIG